MKKAILCILSVCIISCSALAVKALYYSASYYNAIAYNYTYNAPYTNSYNCLAYALGNTTSWIWPWGSSNPTNSQVNGYLYTSGYIIISNGQPYQPKIISYGTTSGITHFSKGNGSGCIAKWGRLERFSHTNWGPYKTTGAYGAIVTKYRLL